MKRFPPRRILVAVDLSGPSMNALDAAKAWALQWGAQLEIVHVQHPPVLTAWVGLDSMPMGLPHANSEPQRKIELKLRKATVGFPPDRLKLRTVHGWPPVALLDLAKPERADLMVMGTHGYAGLDRVLTGSVSEAVLRRARIPIFIVPERKFGPLVPRVLAPWNGRPYATRALRWARELARNVDMSMVVLHVDETGGVRNNQRLALHRRLVKVLGSGLDWRLIMRSGDARTRIVAEANSGRYECVVMSAHRRAFASDFIMGSTIERLLRHSSVPILGVPSGGRRSRLNRRIGARAGARLY